MYNGGLRTVAAGEAAEDDDEDELGMSRLGADGEEKSSSTVRPAEDPFVEKNGGVFPLAIVETFVDRRG